MARRRQFVKGAAAISQKRLTSWFQFQPVRTVLTASGGTLIFSLNAPALALRPFTVVRSRFELWIQSDQEAVSENQCAAVGMAVVSDQAVAVGVSAIPTPITDMGSDLWFVHQILNSKVTIITAVGAFSEGQGYSVDSKAMRKVDIGQDLVVVAELSSATSSGFDINIGGRMLVKVN